MTLPPSSPLLIVDDEADLLETLSDVLTSAGYEVDTAGGAYEAIDRLSQRRYALILSDVRMPKGDGLHLLKHYESMPQPRPLLMMMSGFTDVSPASLVARGVHTYLHKPFSMRDLVTAVTTALQPSK